MKKHLQLGGLIVSFLATSTVFAQSTTQRMPLYETFTSSTCGPCNPGNAHLEGLFNEPENEGKFCSLKYQMSWPGYGDPYYTNEGGSRRGFYGVSSVPRLFVDAGAGFEGNPTGLTQSDMDAQYAEPAIVKLDAAYQVDEETQTVTVQVEMTALQEIESLGGFFLHVAIFEKTTYNNEETNGETQFEHVMKKMLPTNGGTLVGAMDAGEVRSFDFSYTFQGDYILPANASEPVNHSENHTVEEFSDLGVVVFAQRSSTREVYQSAYAGMGTLSTGDELAASMNKTTLAIYPNPTSESAQVAYSTTENNGTATVMVTDYAGKVIYETTLDLATENNSTLMLETQDWDNGFYLVTLQTKEGRKTEKLSVMH